MRRKVKLHPLIKKLTISYAVIALCMWISFEISVPLAVKGFLNLTKSMKWSGLPLTVYGIMGASFSILFGKWADKYGRRKTILMVLGASVTGMSLTGFSYYRNSWIGFIIGAAIIGIGQEEMNYLILQLETYIQLGIKVKALELFPLVGG